MTKNHREIKFLRRHIPSFECKPGCHDCCGPVTTSSEEMAELPFKSEEEHMLAHDELNCPYLGEGGCEVYHDRPLICRLFGTTPQLPCPNGCKPDEMICPQIEQKVHLFISRTRQVLV